MNKMKLVGWMLTIPLWLPAQITLDECQQAARENYPLIRKYEIIRRTTDYTVRNIEKDWLPRLSAAAQVTYQNDVTAWPDAFLHKMEQIGGGFDIDGLKKDQYRIGFDIDQMIFDGGTVKNRRVIARLRGDVQVAQNDVDLYVLRNEVNELFFGILLVNDKITLNEDWQVVLKSNEDKLLSMFRRGIAAESDMNAVKAERLNAMQQHTELLSTKRSLQRSLSFFCGKEIGDMERPPMILPAGENKRPELNLFDAQLKLANAQYKLLDTNLRPKLAVFAQGYYGYPGYNLFESMTSRDWSLNVLIGARLTWNIGSLYTRKNDRAKIELQRRLSENSREIFLFRNKLLQVQQWERIDRSQKLLAADKEIIHLRTSIRLAAESKLKHGIIDVNNLLREINRENMAKVWLSIHEIEMLKEQYNLKYTTNND